jgi:hypothetical protein
MSNQIEDQGVYTSAERWATLRTEPTFVELLRLARVTNSLTLVYPPILASLEDQSPKARRERFGATLYAAALLHEGLHAAQGLGQHFRHMPQYQEGFAAIFADPIVGAFRSSTLDRTRDELVFRFDRDPLAVGLTRFAAGEMLIATAPDFQQGETSFAIADDAVLGYLFGDAPTEEVYLQRVTYLIKQVTLPFNRFMRAAHSLIPAALREMGCYIKPVSRPSPPPDDAG